MKVEGKTMYFQVRNIHKKTTHSKIGTKLCSMRLIKFELKLGKALMGVCCLSAWFSLKYLKTK